MARGFLDENFLLYNRTAEYLYNKIKDEPVFDYHCHLSPQEIAGNAVFTDLTSAWINMDHYKWRMMRAMGIEERLITGSADSYEKFLAWAKTLENLIGNPLYHWSHLELQRYFGIYELLTEKTAPSIWERANAVLNSSDLSVNEILKKFNVHTVGTTDDPVSNLEYHREIAEGKAPIGKIKTKVIPTFRPDNALDIQSENYGKYIQELSCASGVKIKDIRNLLSSLKIRLNHFIKHGCRASDLSLSYIPFAVKNEKQINKIFKKAVSGRFVSAADKEAFLTYMLINLARLYAENDIVMQLHISVLRNINFRMQKITGKDSGFDVINDRTISEKLSLFLGYIEGAGKDSFLPKTVLYSLNPKDYYPILTIMGSFQNKGVRGKMQLGSAWWFCDSLYGIEEQMRALSGLGILSNFIGMTTDSRSFLSYPRHEYFRRILCNVLGNFAENGEYPEDKEQLEKIARNISFGNALLYFS